MKAAVLATVGAVVFGFASQVSAQAECAAPGTQVVTDPAGDQAGGATGANREFDIRSISIAEPNYADGVRKLTVTIKVDNLATLPENGVWRARFSLPGTPTPRYFVGMNTPVESAVPTFTYGTVGTPTTTLGNAEPQSGYSPDGTITIVINNSKVGNPAPGTTLTNIDGLTQQLVGAGGTGATPTHDSTATPGPSYTLVAADHCPIVDADGDGVVDGNDACPNTPPDTPVRPNGCPIVVLDSDGDGISDGDDLCPDTPEGSAVDADGCPVAPPQTRLHFHGNTHDSGGSPAHPCSGNGQADAGPGGCGGPYLTSSASLDPTAPAAFFEDNSALINTEGSGFADPNWIWRPTTPQSLAELVVVEFWGSCNAECIALGGSWDVALWKNTTMVREFARLSATPAAPDVPSLLTVQVRLPSPIELNGTTDRLVLAITPTFTDTGAGAKIYYDSANACPGNTTGPCDSRVTFNAHDSDADGVADILDQCEGTPPGTAVDEKGCAAMAACVAAGAQAAANDVPASGPVRIDDAVRADWAALGDAARYGAFVHFYRQGTPFAQDWVLEQLGLKITHDFRRYTGIVFARGPVAAFKALAAHPWVRRIEHNTRLHYHDATQSWATRARVAHEPVSGGPYYDAANPPRRLTGKGVTVGIIDSGLFGAHPDFAGRISHNFKYSGATYIDVQNGDSENGGGGHGTHVTGTAAGDGTQSDGGYPDPSVAPLVPGTFASAAPESDIIHWGHGAVLFVLNAQVAYQHILDNLATPKFLPLRAVNNSYGDTGGTPYDPNNANQQLINKIVGCNVNMVFSAGNNGGNGSSDTTSSYCKNSTPGVICVASYNDMGMGTRDGPLSTFSSRGRKGRPGEYPDIAAPGDLTTSTCAQATPTQAICTGGDETRAETEWQPWYGTISGTSMASPNITGILGVIAQAAPQLDSAERELLLQRTARRVNLDSDYVDDPQNPGYTIHFGYGAGLVDVQAALDELAVTRAGLTPQGEALTIFAADADPVLPGAADVVKLVMQEYLDVSGAHGVEYRLTVRDAAAFGSFARIAYKIEQNVNGRLYETTVDADAGGVATRPEGGGNTAPAVSVSREGNEITLRVPYKRLGYPPLHVPIHNILALSLDANGVVDFAPSPPGSTGAVARNFPMYGRPFTVQLSSGDPPAGNSCVLPGIETNIDLPADSTAEHGAHEIRSVFFAEPLLLNGASMDGKIVATIKVGDMSTVPPDTLWSLRFETPQAPSGAVGYFIGLSTADAGERFVWGTFTVDSTPAATVTTLEIRGDIDNANSYYEADGTIVLVADKALFNVDTGDKLDTIVGRVGAASSNEGPISGMNTTAFDFTSSGAYVLRGNDICRFDAPVAALAADPPTGDAPITVTFDASGSTATDATIIAYTFDFDDGNDPVTQPEPTIQHTYVLPRQYKAKLVVQDSNGTFSDVVEILVVITPVNIAPVADAGVDFAVAERAGVLLGGRGTDANGDRLSYQWRQLSGPEVKTLLNADTASAFFEAPDVDGDQDLEFELEVTDERGASGTDTIVIRVLDVSGEKAIGNTNVGSMAGSTALLLGLLGWLRLARRREPSARGRSGRVPFTSVLAAAALCAAPGLFAQENVCEAPGRTILTDPSGDALSEHAAHDLERLSIAQPYSATDYKLAFTLKVADLSNVPPGTIWPVHLCSPAFTNCTDPNAAISDTNKYYTVRMVGPGNTANPGATPIFQVLKPNAAGTTRTTVAADGASTFFADGRIRIVVNASDLGLDPAGAGTDRLRKFLSRVSVGGVTPDNMPDSLVGGGEFATVGLQACVTDSDSDGVADANDLCPGTPAGTTVDAAGCKAVVVGGGDDLIRSGGLTVATKVLATNGWVRPGGAYPTVLSYRAGSAGAGSSSFSVTLSDAAVFVQSTPAPASGNGSAGAPLIYDVGAVAANGSGRIVIESRALSLDEDPEVIWKDLSASVSVTVVPAAPVSGRTRGPRVTNLASARYGDRPFPVVNVQYADVGHCTGAGSPLPECSGNHTSAMLDELMNSRTSGRSVWQHWNDMSLGQLNPQASVAAAGKVNVPFTGVGQHKFARLEPAGTCAGTTRAGPPQPQGSGVDRAGTGGADGTPTYPNRIENGWYTLPGTQAYYGSDKFGHGIGGALTGIGVIFGVDDGCGPTGKLAYDAASLADPDIDYNDFDTDRDGLVDFFEILFAGCGGNGCIDPSGVNNVWPHSSSLEFYFVDANGQKGYVSNDQLRDQQERPLWWTSAARNALTTNNMGDALKAYVRVGSYNVNPETAFDFTSVISHEYGHSLGLPDFYSRGSRDTFGTWELMATDHSQYMTGYARQKMGWLVPQTLTDGLTTIRESKYDTHSIKWQRPDGTPYELTGPDVHNADLFKVRMPNPPLIADPPDGTRVTHSGAGDDFGCPPEGGHGLLISLPEMELYPDATAAKLTFKSKFEIEWDYDYGFVLVSIDNGQTWQSLTSAKGTTINGFNPNASSCFTQHGNGITGVSGEPNSPGNPNRAAGEYPAAQWIDDEFDLTPFIGEKVLLLLSYATDPGLAKRGWFVDQLSVDVTRQSGPVNLFATSFELETQGQDNLRFGALGSGGWRFLSSLHGGDADHAYYIELRDRLSWDFRGKGQNDRGDVTWQPGISMIYTNEATGYGNTDGVNPPHQTPVDAAPEPASNTPNLDDAAFTLERPEFNGCTHIDNYEDPENPEGVWKLPGSVKFTVQSLSGLGAGDPLPATPATATILADVDPDCSLVVTPPDLSITAYEDPDADGKYTLAWERPPGAVGPDTLQEATLIQTLFHDTADNFSRWTRTGTNPRWEITAAKPQHAPNSAFWGTGSKGPPATATMTMNAPVALPAGQSITLTFSDWFVSEADDSGTLAISENGGPWTPLYTVSRGLDREVGAEAYATEPLNKRDVDLTDYAGKSIRLRLTFTYGDFAFFFQDPIGWIVDDIRIEANNFTDIVTDTEETTAPVERPNGTYYYRVRTRYPAANATIPSSWSNVVQAVVDIERPPVVVVPEDFTVVEGDPVTLDGSASADPDGDAVEYLWEQYDSEPVVPLTNERTHTASFTAPGVCTDTLLRFRLTGSNAGGTDFGEVAVTVQHLPTAPEADAGADFSVDERAGVLLSGAGTSDPDCEALEYFWRQTSGPVVPLHNHKTATPSFTAPSVPSDTPLTFELTVTDATGASSVDDVTVWVREIDGKKVELGQNELGGAVSPPMLMLVGLLGLFRLRRRGSMRTSQPGTAA